jgi:hypothetical protein
MKRTTKYVGLDIHQARAVHVALEEGTQAQWVHELLSPLVDRVLVCDRRGDARRGPKGDQADADALAEALRRGGLRAVYHGSGPRTTLKELTRAYQQLVEDATRPLTIALIERHAYQLRTIIVPPAQTEGPYRAQGPWRERNSTPDRPRLHGRVGRRRRGARLPPVTAGKASRAIGCEAGRRSLREMCCGPPMAQQTISITRHLNPAPHSDCQGSGVVQAALWSEHRVRIGRLLRNPL